MPGIELTKSSNEIFDLMCCRKRLLVVGGGYIAIEFAGIFAGLGVDTTLSYRGPNLLKNLIAKSSISWLQKWLGKELMSG